MHFQLGELSDLIDDARTRKLYFPAEQEVVIVTRKDVSGQIGLLVPQIEENDSGGWNNLKTLKKERGKWKGNRMANNVIYVCCH